MSELRVGSVVRLNGMLNATQGYDGWLLDEKGVIEQIYDYGHGPLHSVHFLNGYQGTYWLDELELVSE